MNKYDRQKIKVETLPDNFEMSNKQTLILIRDLFEMVKDNNKLIQLMDKRIKILELRLKNYFYWDNFWLCCTSHRISRLRAVNNQN